MKDIVGGSETRFLKKENVWERGNDGRLYSSGSMGDGDGGWGGGEVWGGGTK
jgi:hypothetical protein